MQGNQQPCLYLANRDWQPSFDYKQFSRNYAAISYNFWLTLLKTLTNITKMKFLKKVEFISQYCKLGGIRYRINLQNYNYLDHCNKEPQLWRPS